ncbi:MAG: hypothetical protein IPL54_09325 [Chitinophagaceae bacterium]|nr:hypothetical protein [Chitinophagaceae bacterium]
MKIFVRFLTVILLSFTIASCQKELNFDTVPTSNGQAVGSLKSVSGNCLPSLVLGNYVKDSVLKTSEVIEVAADITAIGTYQIKSDTIAGFYFTGSGSVTTTGLNNIRLAAIGTPSSAGTKIFTISFGTSSCKIIVSVNAGLPPTTAYTFNCSGTTFGPGIYTAGNTVGTTHTVTLNVNVTTPGPYTISTAIINGISFSGTGTFTAAGNTQVTLTASGTPAAASPPVYNYTVTNGTSSCTFSLSVTAPPPAPNLDYVPQTDFSNWSTKLVGGTPADTTFIQVSANSKTFGANSYKIFEVKDMGVPTDSVYNRKNGGLYFQYIDGDLGVLQNPINQEYLLLDSNRAVNYTWTKNFGPNVAMGFPLSNISVDAEIIGKGETQTVASIVYANVIRVKYKYTATVFLVGDVPVAEEERWYARGIGVIRSSIMNLVAPATIVNETTRAQIF